MKTIDFSQPGGFPMVEEMFAFMQDSYHPALRAAFVDAGSNPVIVSGMAVAGNTIGAGWCLIGGLLIPFTASAYDATTPSNNYVAVTETIGSEQFIDGVSRNVYSTKTAAMINAATSPTLGAVQFSSFQHFGVYAGQRARQSVASVLNVPIATGSTTGTMSFQKDPVGSMVNAWGTFTVASPGSLSSPAPYYSGGSIPAGYVPARIVQFAAYFRHHNQTPPTIYSGADLLRQINCEFSPAGFINLGLLAASAAYTVSFNIVYPTW